MTSHCPCIDKLYKGLKRDAKLSVIDLISREAKNNIVPRSDMAMSHRVMGQMGYQYSTGHKGHGSIGLDPLPIEILILWGWGVQSRRSKEI